jgi:uncharacterized membrane protein
MKVVGEKRLPMALAVLALIATTLFPPYLAPWLTLLLAGSQGLLLVILIVGDPGRIDDRSRRLRRVSVGLVALLVATALVGTATLVVALVEGWPETNEPARLLLTGAKIWLTNNIAFALLYWEFDRGGPVERAYRSPHGIDLAFPQDINPELAPNGWRPQFIDYLYLAFTTANAFSPTDTMPLTPWAKVAMGSQALISFAIVGLVIARAVNVFT